MSILKIAGIQIFMLLSFVSSKALAASSEEKIKLDEFKYCETVAIGKTYEYMSGTSESGEKFRVEYEYVGGENEFETFQAIIDVNNKFKYEMGLYSGCSLENSIEYVWVENVPQGYKIFWRVLHTGQAVPEDYQGVILSNEGKFIEKYRREI